MGALEDALGVAAGAALLAGVAAEEGGFLPCANARGVRALSKTITISQS
jgi:hypothetical protein